MGNNDCNRRMWVFTICEPVNGSSKRRIAKIQAESNAGAICHAKKTLGWDNVIIIAKRPV